MIKAMVVGLDGSPVAESVIPYVTEFAAALAAPVTLLTVIDLPQESGEASAHDYLRRVEPRVAKAGVPVSSAVLVGDPAAEIVRYAEHEAGGLIALATHGRSGIARWWYGSVAERVLHSSRIPVLLVRSGVGSPAATGLVNRIVVPLDGRPLAEAVIPLAVWLATALKVTIALVRTVPPLSLLDDPSLGLGASTQRETRAAIRQSAEDYLSRIAGDLRRNGATVTTQAVDGIPAIEIVGSAQAQPGSVVVMATHSRSGITDVLLGSVARRIVHDADVPVLMVRPREFSQAR
jgi:nucleotide-binding universal stress UspA family protein